MSFWPNADHWSVKIPLDTPHPRLDVLAETGWVQLADAPFECPESEYLALEYLDWKSGGEANPGWFYDDGIHLREGGGREGYAAWIVQEIQPAG